MWPLVAGFVLTWVTLFNVVGAPAEWKFNQPVYLPRVGLMKFSLPLETLNAARPGLEDLRLLNPGGTEVPYWTERLPVSAPRVHRAQLVNVRIETGSTVAVFQTGVTQAIVQVTLESPAPQFLKPAHIEVSADQQSWTMLAESQPVFRQRTGAESLAIALPPGRRAFLRLTLDDRRSPGIPITGALVTVEAGPPPPSEPLEIRVQQRVEEPGQTRVWLQLPAANVTLAGLSIDTPEPLFTRNVALSHQQYVDGELREVVIARETISRSAMKTDWAGGNPSIAAGVTVPSAEVVLTIQHEDNPPLQLTAITARRIPLHVVVQATEAGNHTLLSGNSQCAAPRYDLGAFRARLRDAPLESIEAAALATNFGYRSTTIEAFQADGAPLDVSAWPFRKPVRMVEDGWQQVELDLAVLANGDPSMRDLRLIRGSNQVPYILERTPGLRRFSPIVRSTDDPERPAVSRWKLTLPHARLPLTRLTFSSTATYFTRTVRLLEERRDDRGVARPFTLASATLTRAMGASPAKLSLPLSSRPESRELLLEIDNGDNPPLPVQEFDVWHSTARLLFRPPGAGPVHLYYGRNEVDAPRYDLAMAWPQLKNAERLRAELGPEEVLKPSATSIASKIPVTWIFWIVLALVVVVLLVIVARLLPKPDDAAVPPQT